MITVRLEEAPSQLDSLLTRVEERGEVVLICRGEQPVAELRPAAQVNGLPMHPQLSQIKFHEDPVAPLDAEDWPEPD